MKQVLLDTHNDARLIVCHFKMSSIKVVGIYKICVFLVLQVYKGYWFKGNMCILKKVLLKLVQSQCFQAGVFCIYGTLLVHSVQQKSIGQKFSKSRNGSDVRYSCHHNLSRFTFPIFAHSWRFSVSHSLQSITTRIYEPKTTVHLLNLKLKH